MSAVEDVYGHPQMMTKCSNSNVIPTTTTTTSTTIKMFPSAEMCINTNHLKKVYKTGSESGLFIQITVISLNFSKRVPKTRIKKDLWKHIYTLLSKEQCNTYTR